MWCDLKPLKAVADIVSGGTPKSGVAEYWANDIHWITPKDMGKLNDVYVSKTGRMISDLGLKKSSAKLFPANSVILSTRAPIGHLAINLVPMSTNQGCRGLIPSPDLDSKYLYYFLYHNREKLNNLGTGTTFKELSKSALAEVCIPSPTLEIQKQIVAKLDQAFADIEKAKVNAEQNLKNSKELFESYLNQIFTSDDGGWVERSMSDVTLLKMEDGDRGNNYPKKSDFLDEGHCLFLSTKNVRPDGFKFDEIMFISEERDSLLRKGKLQRNDVILTTRGTIGNLALYDDSVDFEHIRINSGMLILRPNTEEILPSYLFETMRSGVVLKQIKDKTSGAAQPQLPIKTLNTFTFPVPTSLEVQKSIVEKLNKLEQHSNDLVEIYTSKINALDELKQSILQKAFNGELT